MKKIFIFTLFSALLSCAEDVKEKGKIITKENKGYPSWATSKDELQDSARKVLISFIKAKNMDSFKSITFVNKELPLNGYIRFYNLTGIPIEFTVDTSSNSSLMVSSFKGCTQSHDVNRMIDFNNSEAFKLEIYSTKKEAIEFAKKDVENGIPFLFLPMGDAPIKYRSDSIFEKKYKVYYRYGNCEQGFYELKYEYNNVVFKFLNNKYGKKWSKEVRKDVIYLDTWEKNN